MLQFLWATSAFQSHNRPPKVAKLAKKSPNLVTLMITHKQNAKNAILVNL
jgi:hypothetical protein